MQLVLGRYKDRPATTKQIDLAQRGGLDVAACSSAVARLVCGVVVRALSMEAVTRPSRSRVAAAESLCAEIAPTSHQALCVGANSSESEGSLLTGRPLGGPGRGGKPAGLEGRPPSGRRSRRSWLGKQNLQRLC